MTTITFDDIIKVQNGLYNELIEEKTKVFKAFLKEAFDENCITEKTVLVLPYARKNYDIQYPSYICFSGLIKEDECFLIERSLGYDLHSLMQYRHY